MLLDSAELGGQLGDDSSSDAALRREVKGVGVCNDRVMSLLSALVISNAVVDMAAIIVVDGVAIYLSEETVNIGWVSRWHGCQGIFVIGGTGQWCSMIWHGSW